MSDWPWPAPDDDGGARHLMAGLTLPDLPLPATDGRTLSLARLPGRWIVFVYPWTGRPGFPNPPDWDDIRGAHGSTPEAEGFRDHHDAFRKMGLDVLGLMTVGPTEGGPEAARPGFAAVRAMVDRLGLAWCSMGMTDDLEVAVQEGATQVRVGSALFGPRDDARRPYPGTSVR